MVDVDQIALTQRAFERDISFSRSADEKARELLKEMRKRDRNKVRVKHPTLPNTWLLVDKKKAKKLNAT